MARVGINPARKKLSSYRPAAVTAAVISYIPNLEGYFADKLRVLKLVLSSLRANTAVELDLLVFDNASCQTVRDYLLDQQRQGAIDYLLLSGQNIGKIGAFQIIFNAAPGEVIAYCDDDILHYPGWLEAQLEILEHIPQVGMVSGVPVRNASGHAHQSLDLLAQQPPPGIQVCREARIPDEWERDWAASTGRDPAAHLAASRGHQDLVLRANTPAGKQVEAIGAANHFQFIGYRTSLLRALPPEWSGRLMGNMVEFDEAIDACGLLRLSTVERFTRHIGNALGAEILQEVRDLGLVVDGGPTQIRSAAGHKHWLLKFPGARRVLKTTYDKLFDVLFR